MKHEYMKYNPRRIFIAEHNRITRDFHPNRNAIIADTVRNGYEQITSFCRHVRKVKDCVGDEMLSCLRSREALAQSTYRWAGRPAEDKDTYIDLPLSSAHPSLSTTILKTVYPNATLQLSKFNARNSTCPDIPSVRAVYNEIYASLDIQVAMLKRRMLLIAGYPYHTDISSRFGKVGLDDMLDAANMMERSKYNVSLVLKRKRSGYSGSHKELIQSVQHWSFDEKGNLIVKARRV